jgi:hypothetical protein
VSLVKCANGMSFITANSIADNRIIIMTAYALISFELNTGFFIC